MNARYPKLKVKHCSLLNMGQSPNSDDVSSKLKGIPFIQGCAEFGKLYPEAKYYCDNPRKVAKVNSILISVRAPVGAMNIANVEIGIGRGVCAVEVNKNTTDGKYLYYSITASLPELQSFSTGSTYDAVSTDDLGRLSVSLPPLPIQKTIATYLDKETARIDALIAKKERQIELLQEKRQAIITRAISKGLDPNAKMKDSGVEWIGEIPESWQVRKLRYLGKCQNGISKGGESFGSGFPFVSYGDAYKNYELPKTVEGLIESTEEEREIYSVQAGDVLFTRTSETVEEIGFASTCMHSIQGAVFAGFLIRFRPAPNTILASFSKYYFRSSMLRKYFVREMNIVTRASLSQDLLKSLPVLLPPYEEMRAISDRLNKMDSEINDLQERIRQSIAMLKEYRSSLITAAVAGEISTPVHQV